MPMYLNGGGGTGSSTWATLVGKPLEFNAGKIKEVLIDDAAKADGRILKYDAAEQKFVFTDPSAGSGEQNVQSDWNQSNTEADDFIKNKPIIPDVSKKVSVYDDDITLETFEEKSARILITDEEIGPAGSAAPSWSSDGDIILKY